MFGSKIKVSKDLLDRCKQRAAEMGYSSVEEFVVHTLEKELRNVQQRTGKERDEIMKRLKGLGYVE
jgi:hypothetical protein